MEGEKLRRKDIFSVSIENLKWLKRNYNRLKKEYDNKWVIIHDKKVVGCGDTFNEILPETKKYEPSSVLLEYIHSKEVAMFFWQTKVKNLLSAFFSIQFSTKVSASKPACISL